MGTSFSSLHPEDPKGTRPVSVGTMVKFNSTGLLWAGPKRKGPFCEPVIWWYWVVPDGAIVQLENDSGETQKAIYQNKTFDFIDQNNTPFGDAHTITSVKATHPKPFKVLQIPS